MGDGLLGGRHHAVVGSNDDDGNIGDLSTTGTHGCEGLVTWSVEEGNLPSVFQLNVIGTDVLGDTTSLTGNHIGVADMVEQRCLTVVYVSHHRHNRCAAHQVVLVILLLGDGVLYLGAHIFGGEAKLVGHDVDGLGIESLVDTYHDADSHAGADDLVDPDIHHRGQLGNSHELGQFEHFALCCLSSQLFAHALLHGLALLLTIFGAFLVLVLRSQTGQRLFYLACHILLVHLKRFLVALLLILLVAVASTGIVVFVVLAVEVAVLSSSLNVDTLIADAHALLFLLAVVAVVSATGLCCLLLTFLAALFLRLLLRASALVQRVKVNLTLNLQLRSIVQHLLLVLGHKDLGLGLCGISSRFLCLRCRLGRLLLYRFWLFLHGLCWFLGLRCLHDNGLCRFFLHSHNGLGLRLFGWFLCRFLNRLWLRLWLNGNRLFLFGLWLNLFRLGLNGLFLLFRLSAHGSLLCLRIQTIQIYLPQRIELLAAFLKRRFGFRHSICRPFLLLRVLLEEFVGLSLHFFVALELLHEGFILGIAQFEVGVRLYLTQFIFLF